jgi:phosphoadenosine phosphosulfate reductase
MYQYAVGNSYAYWIDEAARSLEKANPNEIIEWAFNVFGDGLTIATGFGAEGMVLIDIAAESVREPDVFFIDTGFLFDETLALRRRIEDRYGITIRGYQPDLSPRQQEEQFGAELWKSDPDLCCRIRKLEPLKQALQDRDAWMTAIRRDQTAARQSARPVEWDERWGLVKVNPLVNWTRHEVWNYIRTRDIPYNPLHDIGYPSIGCTHCTRPVNAGEDERAGRWAGQAKTECGLHSGKGSLRLISLDERRPRVTAD